jgi:hypothetical protein
MNAFTIQMRGIQEVQRANLQAIREMRPGGALSRGVQTGLVLAHQKAVIITHVRTGALRASHRIDFVAPQTRGYVFIDPASVNPEGEIPAEYGIVEHNRGGSHAFYERVVEEYGTWIGETAGQVVLRGLP